MPGILNDTDSETVRRTVPKPSNKIQAVAVARLYVAYPNQSRWKYTGLQGAAVLCNDLVGNTFWIKLVDISPSNRGVIWDQEIYDTFAYNQDRTFFHSFELEECLAGLSFVDEKEAKQFKKKMDEREKNASKGTKAQPFGSNRAGGALPVTNGTKSHSRLGGFSSFLHGHRHSSNPTIPQPASSIIPPRESVLAAPAPTSLPINGGIDLADPTWRPILDELVQMGITEDQIAQNADFIRQYVAQKQAEETARGIADAMDQGNKSKTAPPPPPPSVPPSRLSPQNTGATTSSRRGPPPAPPPARRPVGGRPPSPPRSVSPPSEPSPPTTPQPRFRAPPPLADAGKFAVPQGPGPTGRARAVSNSSTLANPGPPPPPRPPKTPIDEDGPSTAFRVPPPFTGERKSSAPPLPPSRGPVPPPPPAREMSAPVPPPLPPKTPQGGHSVAPAVVPPPPPSRNNAPPLPPPNARPTPPPPSLSSQPPPPPPLPFSSGAPPPPPLPSSSGPPPPPPPPLPSSGGPPPPPPPPPPGAGAAPPLPKPAGGRDDLLSAIRSTGGGGLRKVKDTEKRDRSAAIVPGTDSSATPAAPGSGGGATAAPDAGAGLAGALAAALSQRKKKVSGSDDEKEDDDEW